MTQEMRERMAAYRQKKEDAKAQLSGKIERIAWNVEMGVLKEFPEAEFRWQEPGDGPNVPLQLFLRHKDWALTIPFDHKALDNPENVAPWVIEHINREMLNAPIRHWVE